MQKRKYTEILYGCNFFWFHNHMEIDIVKGMVHHDSCTSVVPNISTHGDNIGN